MMAAGTNITIVVEMNSNVLVRPCLAWLGSVIVSSCGALLIVVRQAFWLVCLYNLIFSPCFATGQIGILKEMTLLELELNKYNLCPSLVINPVVKSCMIFPDFIGSDPPVFHFVL
jgi:hypothetical protein